LGVLWRIVMPLSLPGIVAVDVVAFFFSWNEYLFTATLIPDPSSTPASVGIATLISQLDSPVQQLLAAGIMFAILPVLFYLSVQRLIVAGLTARAVKAEARSRARHSGSTARLRSSQAATAALARRSHAGCGPSAPR